MFARLFLYSLDLVNYGVGEHRQEGLEMSISLTKAVKLHQLLSVLLFSTGDQFSRLDRFFVVTWQHYSLTPVAHDVRKCGSSAPQDDRRRRLSGRGVSQSGGSMHE